LAAAAADAIVVLFGGGRRDDAVRDGVGNGVSAAADVAHSVGLACCLGEARTDGAGAVGLAAAAADESVVLRCRGRSRDAARDGAGNGVLAPAEAADLVVFV